MMSIKHLFIPAITVPMLLGALPASASQFEDSGLYIGGNYGMIRVQDSDFDDDNDFLELTGGLQILPFLGVEASYYDFGEYGNAFYNVETTATSLSLTGRLPLSNIIAVYAKLGPMWWDTDVRSGSFSADYDGEDVKFGTGISFELSPNLDLRAEYNWVDMDIDGSDITDTSPGDFDSELSTVSIGFKLQF